MTRDLSPEDSDFALTEAALQVVQVAREAQAWKLELAVRMRMHEHDEGISTAVVALRQSDGTYNWTMGPLGRR